MLRHAATSSITLGIVVGLVVGKPVGIVAVTWLETRRRLGGLPLTVPWLPLVGAGTVAGVGFTVALLIASITFEGAQLEDAKLGILAASLLASTLSWCVFQVIGRLPDRVATVGEARLVAPIVDLATPVDPEVDHVRGTEGAPVTIVEYGDFECPYCGQAEVALRDLAAARGGDLRFVYRHLPLSEVHERAELAAEAAEAAGAQGRFWDFHDLLFAHQEALSLADLRAHAADLGLDVERFASDVDERRHALRVARDVGSADASGVAGTPTFFVNGRRHHGPFDLESLLAVVDRELGVSRGRR